MKLDARLVIIVDHYLWLTTPHVATEHISGKNHPDGLHAIQDGFFEKFCSVVTFVLAAHWSLTSGVSQFSRGPRAAFSPFQLDTQDFMYNIKTLGTKALANSSASRARKNIAVLIVGSVPAHEISLGSFKGYSSVYPWAPFTIGVT